MHNLNFYLDNLMYFCAPNADSFLTGYHGDYSLDVSRCSAYRRIFAFYYDFCQGSKF